MDAALSTAKDATDWLSTGGGWAMFIVAGVVIYFLVRHILSLNAKIEAKETAFHTELSAILATFRKDISEKDASHKAEMDRVMQEFQDKLEKKDEKLFGLLDQTNELMAAIQQLKPR